VPSVLSSKHPLDNKYQYAKDFLVWLIANGVTVCDVGPVVESVIFKGVTFPRRFTAQPAATGLAVRDFDPPRGPSHCVTTSRAVTPKESCPECPPELLEYTPRSTSKLSNTTEQRGPHQHTPLQNTPKRALKGPKAA